MTVVNSLVNGGGVPGRTASSCAVGGMVCQWKKGSKGSTTKLTSF
jgi:hypothetical protein